MSFNQIIIICVVAYLFIINIVAFAMMGIDKAKARRKEWRVPEANLFLSAILGGSIGAIAGMQHFRHKTKHWYFVVGMPAILILQIVAAGFVYLHFFA